jgi:hypothetical protein
VTIFAIISTHFTFGLDVRKTGYNLFAAVPLLVVAIYRVLQCLSTDPKSPVRSLAAFWILMILFELSVLIPLQLDLNEMLIGSVAYVMLLSISLPSWYPAVKKAKEEDLEMKGSPKYSWPK